MKVTVSGVEYKIEFLHDTEPARHPVSSITEQRERTRCVVVSVGHEFLGTARRYFLDTPNREKARRAAMTAALSSSNRFFTREERGEFWKAYLASKKPAAVSVIEAIR